MNKDDQNIIWHHPNNFPVLGTVEQVENLLNQKQISYKTSKSFMKDHTAFSVGDSDKSLAVRLIKRKFGRRL